MHVITQKRIWEAKRRYPETAGALDGWYRIVKHNPFYNFAEIKRSFGSVDKVNEFYIFDIGGNKLRLIANIHFHRQKIYISNVLTHKEYEKSHRK
jgi:mRNA interferase HigB